LLGDDVALLIPIVRGLTHEQPENVKPDFIVEQHIGEFLVQARGKEPIRMEKTDHTRERIVYTADQLEKLPKRPPIICIMGHVDHGKTTLLDYLRNTNVVAGEAGGITQKIGAFTVKLPEGGEFDTFTVIDTPGHAAFTGMRKKGANVVDCVILVVDATDAVQPQTRESLAIIKETEVPFIVALNKCDRDSAEPERLKRELLKAGVEASETEFIEISALKGTNINELLETVETICELADPRADPDALGDVVLLESQRTEEGSHVHGIVVNGSVELREYCVCGDIYAKIVRMQTDQREIVHGEKVGPSTPVQISGFREMPSTADDLLVVMTKTDAQLVTRNRKIDKKLNQDKEKQPEFELTEEQKKSFTRNPRYHRWFNRQSAEEKKDWLASVFPHRKKPGEMEDINDLNIMIQADSWGSIDAISTYIDLIEIPDDELKIRVLEKDIGPLSMKKARYYDNKNVIFLGFGVEVPRDWDLAHGQLISHNIIFSLIDELMKALEERLDPDPEDNIVGEAECKQVFTINKGSKVKEFPIAGSTVQMGKLKKDLWFKIEREDIELHEQEGAAELKHFKDNIEEIENGKDCGLKLDFEFWKPGDKIVCFERTYHPKKLPHPHFTLFSQEEW